jgi:hypothetical protein
MLEGRANLDCPPKRWRAAGFKKKDLIGIPWMLAFALRADGWYLRQDIIWHKPNPMPESIRDRCTKAHEYVFLLSKSPQYFFDDRAIAEPCEWDPADTKMPDGWDTGAGGHGSFHRNGREKGPRVKTTSGNAERKERPDAPEGRAGNQAGSIPWAGTTRIKRDVWTVASRPYRGAHFATFPPALIEPMILAGTSAKGVCPACRAPWTRQVKRDRRATRPGVTSKVKVATIGGRGGKVVGNRDPDRHVTEFTTVGWRPGCTCDAGEPVQATVLDPFVGSGTTIAVAVKLGRLGLGIELNPEYAKLAEKRLTEPLGIGGLFPPKRPVVVTL